MSGLNVCRGEKTPEKPGQTILTCMNGGRNTSTSEPEVRSNWLLVERDVRFVASQFEINSDKM